MAEGKKRGPKMVTEEHKAAMAVGRSEGRSVRVYLEALEVNRPKRGRKRTPDSIAKRLAVIEAELANTDPLSRVNLIQERIDLGEELEGMGSTVDMSALEAGFVEAAKAYSDRKGISYAAWRAIGIDAALLKRASITK